MKGLLEMELEVLEEGREWIRRRLQERLQEQIDAIGAVCPQAGIMLKNQRRRQLKLRSVSGVLELNSWYGYSRARGAWVCPCREVWGLEPYQRSTPELQSRMCFTATQANSYEGAARVADRWGCPVSDDLIREEVQRQGKEAAQAHWPPQKSSHAQEEFSMVIMMDGWMARERGTDWGLDPKKPSTQRVAWREIYGEGTPESKKWVTQLLHQLRHGKEDRVIRRLEEILEKWEFQDPDVQETVEREVHYFVKHRDHLHYQDRADEGAPMGSGAVESLARQLQNRFKSCRQFWNREGLTNLLAIITTVKNNDESFLWN